MERRERQKLMRKQMGKVVFSNRHAPGSDELRPGVAPVLSGERDARREQGQAVYFQALEQTKISCPEPLPASAERGGGGWGRGLARSQARRPAPLGSAAEGKRRGLSGERSRPQLGGTPKTVRGFASRSPCGGAPSGLTWGEGGRRGLGRPLAPAAEPLCCTQPRLPTEARPWLSRRFPLGVLATASAASGAVYTVGPRTPPPPSLHPSAVADSAAATSSAAASSLWSIFQPPNPEKQRLQPRRQETPPQLLGGRSGQNTGGFSAIEQQPLRSFCLCRLLTHNCFTLYLYFWVLKLTLTSVFFITQIIFS